VVSYTQFVKKVSKSLKGWIVAFDNMPDRAGCILYLKGSVRTIIIESAAIEIGADDIIAVLLAELAEREIRSAGLLVTVRDGVIAVEEHGRPAT
jgi:hypothetical protein